MKRIAIFVGINAYPESPLRCARADAETLYREFRSRYDATKLLVDKEASPERIVGEIENFQRILSPGDMFLFYFSGHGCEQDGSRFVAIPQYDVQGNSLELAGLTINALKDMTDIKGLHRLFVLDCCRNVLRSVEDVGARGKMAGYLHRHGSRSIIQPTILSSSAPGQTSYEHIESGHGYFTEAFLAAIRNSEVRSFNMFRDRLDFEMQSLRTPASQDPYFEGGIGSNLPFWPTWEYGVEHAPPAPGGATSRKVNLGDVIDAFNGLSHSCFFIGGAIPEKKRRNAWNSMRVKGYDSTILALFDNTFWGGSSDGFVLTEEGLYARNSSSDAPCFVAWSDMRRIDAHEKYLIVNDIQIDTLYFDDDSRQKCCQGLAELAAFATGGASDFNPAAGGNNSSVPPCNCFRFAVEDKFWIEGRGCVVTGIVCGEKVSVGQMANIYHRDRFFRKVTIIGIEKNRSLVDVGEVGDYVGLLLRSEKSLLLSELEQGMVLVSSNVDVGVNTSATASVLKPGTSHPTIPFEGVLRIRNRQFAPTDGRKIPCRKKKSNYPHVLIRDKNGALAPEPGYAWVNGSYSNDYGVIWKPGFLHPDISHIVASDVEGYWIPESGYEWDGAQKVRKK